MVDWSGANPVVFATTSEGLTTPNRLITVVDSGAGSAVTPNQMVARVGVIPPPLLGQPLQLAVGVGDGGRVALCPANRDVVVQPDNWVWRGVGTSMASAQGSFFALQSGGGTTASANFHSGGPAGGMLVITLDKEWGVESRYCISARIHAAGRGADTRIGSVTFTAAGSRLECAQRICDLLVKAFAAPPPGNPPNTPLNITCQVTANVLGDAVITVKLANGTLIQGGNIDIIQKGPPPVITGLWDIQNAGLWRKEVRKHELARWYRCYEWRTAHSLWFERRAEGLWITRQALETFTCSGHCIYRFPNGRTWVIWRTYSRADLVRFRVQYRFW